MLINAVKSSVYLRWLFSSSFVRSFSFKQNNDNSLARNFFIEAFKSCQDSEQSCICVLRVLNLPVSANSPFLAVANSHSLLVRSSSRTVTHAVWRVVHVPLMYYCALKHSSHQSVLNSQYLRNKYDNWPQWINIQMSLYDSKSIEIATFRCKILRIEA